VGRLRFLWGAARYTDKERRAADHVVWRERKAAGAPRNDSVEIGRGTHGTPRVVTHFGDVARVSMGQFCSIADDVIFLRGANHHPDWVSTYSFRVIHGLDGAFEDGQPWSKGDIVVGNDVWIGHGARVLSGVTIGDGAIVAAFSVVTRDVRPYALVAGSPATERKRRFTDEQIDALLKVAWWDWPIEQILAVIPRLCSDDIDGFIAHGLGSGREIDQGASRPDR
jgi:acetyltransferase-like isoleucine patch superfamily enzyme